jgi:acyl-coenzyme A synthetase/AMP-(fatty) acid ligase
LYLVPPVPSPRQELAARLLGGGARLCGVALSADRQDVAHICKMLRASGVMPGQVVELAGLPGPDLLVAIAAVWAVDAVPRPSVAGAPLAGCHYVLSPSELRALAENLLLEHGVTALLHATSGSSAVAKVARRSVASILQEANGYREGLSLCSTDRVAVPVPVAHSFGSGVALSALLSGCDVYPDNQRLPSTLAAEVDGGTLNKVAVTPALGQLLARTRRSGTCTADAVLVGAGVLAEKLSVELADRFGAKVTVGYGSTETGGTFIGGSGLGAPIAGVEVVEPQIGQEGQLVLRTATPVLGYVNEELRTSPIWRTGDLVVHEAPSALRYVRRVSDELVRLNGSFVDVACLREAVEHMPGVSEHAFVVIPDQQSAGVEALYLVLATKAVTPPALVRQLPWRGPPVRIVTCGALPRNGMGKLDRVALAQMARAV